MALKFPGMNKGNSASTPAVKPAKSAKSGSSLFGFLSKVKKPALSAAGTQPGGESTGSGFGQNDSGCCQCRRRLKRGAKRCGVV